MKLKSIKPLFGLVLVFMLGAVSGSLITYMAARAHFFETISGNGTHMREEVSSKASCKATGSGWSAAGAG